MEQLCGWLTLCIYLNVWLQVQFRGLQHREPSIGELPNPQLSTYAMDAMVRHTIRSEELCPTSQLSCILPPRSDMLEVWLLQSKKTFLSSHHMIKLTAVSDPRWWYFLMHEEFQYDKKATVKTISLLKRGKTVKYQMLDSSEAAHTG